MLYPVILSGGVGKRLWPVSKKSDPKQFQKLFNDKTLLENTYDRVCQGFDKKNIFLVSNIDSLDYIKKIIDIDPDNILSEPQAKGTAMAIALAAFKIFSIDPEANIVVVNSDNFIKDEDNYIDLLKKAEEYLDGNYSDKFLLAGIKPVYPETGYGYIQLDKKVEDNLYTVESFREKPDEKTAQEYIEKGFLWNPAIFLFKAKELLAWYEKFLPDIYQALQSIGDDFSLDNLTKHYSSVEKISIDCGLLEKMDDMLVIPTDIKWADIGHWRSLRDVLLEDKKDNICNVKNISIDSHNNLFYSSSGKLVASLGVEDMIMVETDDVVFLCRSDRAQDIKNLLQEIKNKKLDKYL